MRSFGVIRVRISDPRSVWICLDHGASKEPANPWPECIRRFLWCTMSQTDPDRSWITDPNSDHPKGTHPNYELELIMQSALFFSFVLVSSPPRSYFRLNHIKKVRKRCPHSRFSFQTIILGFFYRNVGLCCSCFSVAKGDRAIFVQSSNDVRWKISQAEKEVELKSYKDHCRFFSSCPPPSYSKAKNPYGEPVCRLKLKCLWNEK